MANKSLKSAKLNHEKEQKLVARRFRDRNRKFLRLPINEQRIKIIKDVITRLETEKMVAKNNRFLRVIGIRRRVYRNENLHELLEQNKCEVCGIGGVFTAAVLLKNKIKVGNLFRNIYVTPTLLMNYFRHGHVAGSDMVIYLRKWFTRTQLELIEAAFEVSLNYANGTFDTSAKTAVEFGRKYTSAKSRLLAICKNMLENNGKFVPKQMVF